MFYDTLSCLLLLLLLLLLPFISLLFLFFLAKKTIILILPKSYTVICVFYFATEYFSNYYTDWQNVKFLIPLVIVKL